jgi:hypothetical protein
MSINIKVNILKLSNSFNKSLLRDKSNLGYITLIYLILL